MCRKMPELCHRTAMVPCLLRRMDLTRSPHNIMLEACKRRSRRALACARVTRMALVLAIGATLYAEPQLRTSIYAAGSDVIMDRLARPAQSIAELVAAEPRRALAQVAASAAP